MLNDKLNDYKVANLSQDDYQYLLDKEAKLRTETKKQYILIAYEKK